MQFKKIFIKIRNLFIEPITDDELWSCYGVAIEAIYKEEEEKRKFLAEARHKYSLYESWQEWKRTR
jgi:hypothetical protein